MFKKLILTVALLALLAGHVYAGQSVKTLIGETELTKTARQVVSDAANIDGANKVSFFVTANGTADSVSCEVSVEISKNGTDWLRASFRDFAGGSTSQTAETNMEGDYYMWLDRDYITAPYVRISVGLVGNEKLSAADTNTVSVTIVTEQ